MQPDHSYEQMHVFLRDVIVPLNEVNVALEDEEVLGMMAVNRDSLDKLYVEVGTPNRGVRSGRLSKPRSDLLLVFCPTLFSVTDRLAPSIPGMASRAWTSVFVPNIMKSLTSIFCGIDRTF